MRIEEAILYVLAERNCGLRTAQILKKNILAHDTHTGLYMKSYDRYGASNQHFKSSPCRKL